MSGVRRESTQFVMGGVMGVLKTGMSNLVRVAR